MSGLNAEFQPLDQDLLLRLSDKTIRQALGKIYSQQNLGLTSVAVTADYTALNSDAVLFVDATAGNIILTLAAANTWGSGKSPLISIIRTDSSTNTVTVTPQATDTINTESAGVGVLITQGRYEFLTDSNTGWWFQSGMTSKSIEIFGPVSGTSSTNWICPAGITLVWVTLVGSGSGGGAGQTATRGGPGGGGGEALLQYPVTVVPGTTYAIGLSYGGVGGALSGVAGGAGTDSTFGSLLTARGGVAPVTTSGAAGGGSLGGAAQGTANTAGNNASFGVQRSGGGGGASADTTAATASKTGGNSGFAGGGAIGSSGGAGNYAGAGGGASYGIGGKGANGGANAGTSAPAYGGGGGGGGGASAGSFGAGGDGGSGYCMIEWIG
jgi:hypothetical protein